MRPQLKYLDNFKVVVARALAFSIGLHMSSIGVSTPYCTINEFALIRSAVELQIVLIIYAATLLQCL